LRRVLIGATALAIVISFSSASSVGVRLEAAKVDPALRSLVAHGGYGKDPLIRQVVPGYRGGSIYYLAQLNGPIDASALRELRNAGAVVRMTFPEISWVALKSSVRAISLVSRLDRVAHLQIDNVQRVLGASISYANARTAARAGWASQAKRGTGDLGADDAWAAGITGAGVTIGVADSGTDGTHPDLDDQDWLKWGRSGLPPKLKAFRDCQGTLPALVNGVTPPDSCQDVQSYDDNGHGTHVSGIATGTAQGGDASQQGRFPGMAPGSDLAVAKVCAAAGVCLNSSVMAGMRWLAAEKSQGGAGADVINMSLGGSRFVAAGTGAVLGGAQLETNDDAEDQLINALSRAHNVLFVVAAGNSGPVLGSIGNPAEASQALAVGASASDFDLAHPTEQTQHGEFGDIAPRAPKYGAIGIAGFSSRGPGGDRLVKPDVVAPGAYVISALSKEATEVRAGNMAHLNNFSTDQTYAVLSGTSMASPAAAGAAALVIGAYKDSIGTSPLYYRVKAALANTAGGHAFEGPVVGLIGGVLARSGAVTPEERYPTRNRTWVGVTGQGPGRIDVPDAVLAITHGVLVYTPASRSLGNIRQLQPSWGMDDIAPGGSSSTTLLLHGAPKMPASAETTFSVEQGREPIGVNAAPRSWFTLPDSVTATRNADVPATFGLHVPTDAAPGMYEATILGSVKLGSVTEHLRIPVQFFVRMIPRAGKASITGPIWASGVSDYTIVGFENPAADQIATDWTMIPLRLSKATKDVSFSVYDTKGSDTMDVFVFDANGTEIDSTVSNSPDHWLPNGLLYLPSSKGSPSTVTIPASAFDGSNYPKLPTTVWIAVSDSGPANAPGFSTYHLNVNIAN
jgi:subtilisin family serine protease